jgi:hypothetical protein
MTKKVLNRHKKSNKLKLKLKLKTLLLLNRKLISKILRTTIKIMERMYLIMLITTVLSHTKRKPIFSRRTKKRVILSQPKNTNQIKTNSFHSIMKKQKASFRNQLKNNSNKENNNRDIILIWLSRNFLRHKDEEVISEVTLDDSLQASEVTLPHTFVRVGWAIVHNSPLGHRNE